jgi:hypothetical protein
MLKIMASPVNPVSSDTSCIWILFNWLVVWNMNFMTLHSVGKNNPNWRTHIFQRGIGIPTTSYLYQISITVFICYLGQSSKRRRIGVSSSADQKQPHTCIPQIFSKHGYLSKKSTQRHALVPGRVTVGLLWNPKLGTSRWPMQPVKKLRWCSDRNFIRSLSSVDCNVFFVGCVDYGILDQASTHWVYIVAHASLCPGKCDLKLQPPQGGACKWYMLVYQPQGSYFNSYCKANTGWWFVTSILFFHILGIIIPTD